MYISSMKLVSLYSISSSVSAVVRMVGTASLSGVPTACGGPLQSRAGLTSHELQGQTRADKVNNQRAD